jgi:putative ABC transport system substrate-binding protein
MERREFITLVGGAAIAGPLRAHAQQSAGKISRVAFLYPGTLDNRSDSALFEVFRAGLREAGYVEGRNLVLDSRSADQKTERLPSLVSELVALRPNVIVAVSAVAVAAAQRATSTIPIVMCPGGEPVVSGFIKSLARPGGNITGLADLNDASIGKLIELLHLVVPSARRIAVLISSNPNHPYRYELADVEARRLGLVAVPIRTATPADIDQAFENMARENCDAIVVLPEIPWPALIWLAAARKMPAFYLVTSNVDQGGLASYGHGLTPMWRKAADYVARILKGADPAELPVEQPVVFELVLNLRTAAALGIAFPDTVIARADRVIE